MHTLLGAATSRRTFLKTVGGGAAALAVGGLAMPALAQNNNLTIIFNGNNENQIAALRATIDAFQTASGSTVTLNLMDHEAHKTAIRNYLVAGAPDVCFWFSGNRMKAFVDRGLFDDISDLVNQEDYGAVLGGTLSATTVGGKVYGLPLAGTLWGNFYLKNVFEEKGLVAPTTWDELLTYSEAAKSAGMSPLAFGSKELWPCAGFFDILNLRINGLDNHIGLMDGHVSYLDPMLQPVFDRWEELIKAGVFTENHTSYGWQEAGALLSQRKAGMMNLGNFVKYAVPEADQQHLTFVPFPKIADIPRFEDFSTDSIHVPANAKNKELARQFLAFFYQPENLHAFLAPAGNVPPRNDMPPSDDPLVNAAVESLKGVTGTAQYYDRDTDPDMAQAGLNGFQEFMAHPERREQILTRLDDTRKRIFGA
jgi:multiple sugar transport system substrate-binding protein